MTLCAMNKPSTLLPLAASLLAALLILFGGQVFLTSIDAVFHYTLVHEIYTYGFVHPDIASFPTMAVYPRAAHWIAAIVGWIGGSDLTAMTVVLIASIFLSYFFVAMLVHTERGIIAVLAFAMVFATLANTLSQV